MRNLWVGAVMSLALACPTAYAHDMMPEEGPQAQEVAEPAKHQSGTHKKHMHKKRAKKHRHHPKQHHHKHHAKKHHAVPAGQETPAEQKIDQETDQANSHR